MGQAYDREGTVLGEAFGETKKDVFDKLIKEHPEAHELGIKTLEANAVHAAAEAANTGTAPRDRMEQFFQFAHLPPHLQAVSRPFAELAGQIVSTLPSNPERTVALRKLLEAKDCAVRALLFK